MGRKKESQPLIRLYEKFTYEEIRAALEYAKRQDETIHKLLSNAGMLEEALLFAKNLKKEIT